MIATNEHIHELRRLYLDLLKKALMHSLWYDKEPNEGALSRKLRTVAPSIFGHPLGTLEERTEGRVWPQFAHTMIGLPRLENLQECVETAIRQKIPGDLVETGVWRGGACIFMRGVLKAWGDGSRKVWAADSFEGLPKPDTRKAPKDRGDKHHKYSQLVVSLEEVKENFRAYGLLDQQVEFLKGWFKETLPIAPIESVAVLRLDGDMYESTMDALQALYQRVSPGGFVIIDDYRAVPGCKQAVDDFRYANGIDEEMRSIDWAAVFWQKRPQSE